MSRGVMCSRSLAGAAVFFLALARGDGWCVGTIELGTNVAGVAFADSGLVAGVGYGAAGMRVCRLKNVAELDAGLNLSVASGESGARGR